MNARTVASARGGSPEVLEIVALVMIGTDCEAMSSSVMDSTTSAASGTVNANRWR
jgi:hypothetical protein